MGIIKDLRLFFSYRKIIRQRKIELESNYNVRIDNADRLYTVVNVPAPVIGEAYELKKSDVDKISEGYIRDYISKLSRYLDSIGLSEIYDYYEPIKKVDKLSYLIVIGFKPLNSVQINNILYRILLPISIITLIITLLFIIF